jgi:hypothetical protein
MYEKSTSLRLKNYSSKLTPGLLSGRREGAQRPVDGRPDEARDDTGLRADQPHEDPEGVRLTAVVDPAATLRDQRAVFSKGTRPSGVEFLCLFHFPPLFRVICHGGLIVKRRGKLIYRG